MFLILKKPSAWITIAMSLIILAMILFRIAVFGVPDRQADEGPVAHLFQIWLVVEVLSVAFFAIAWLPQKPGAAVFVLAMQIVVALAACAPVFFLSL